MNKVIKLYTTSGCHLCEQADAMIRYLVENKPSFSGYQIKPVEISEDDLLIEQYAIRIPVLSKEDKELGWPFELQELQRWLLD